MSNTETDLSQASQDNSGQLPLVERKPLSRSLFVGLGVAALLLGVVIYSGIHQRAMAASSLGVATDRAAIAAVDVVEPKPGAGENGLCFRHDLALFDKVIQHGAGYDRNVERGSRLDLPLNDVRRIETECNFEAALILEGRC